MRAFGRYVAAPHQIRAIHRLEENINPYVLAEFANTFRVDEEAWD
jgi:hypothetical protein